LVMRIFASMDDKRPITDWLPITLKEINKRDLEELDVILISGDAYVDHPSFGVAVVGRLIESCGLRIAIVPQPNWKDDLRDFRKFGKPKYFFGVTSGCMDTMVNHYTANKRLRSTDAYTPGNVAGFRPDYAVSTYSKILKSLYPDVPVLIGGIEASLRRLTHYDYWADKLMPSILEDSKADMLVYGMGEMPLLEIISWLKKGVPFEQLDFIPQTVIKKGQNVPVTEHKKWEDIEIASHDLCLRDKLIVVNPPYPTMTESQIDKSFDLPYTRLPHPKYKKRGAIPAYEMIKFSINMHRGCFGGCSFCTISAHQGKFIASRSEKSILDEVEQTVNMPDFKGYISDLGGPSANMYKMKGYDQDICDRCQTPSCIHPVVCSNLDTSHQAMIDIYKKVDANPKVKKAFVGSGIRYDLLTKSYNKKADNSAERYMEQVLTRHVSGRLKVAPEHTAPRTLHFMRKPSFEHFKNFKKKFDQINRKHNLKQQLIPYFISGHPDSEQEDMADLAVETKEMGFKLEQVQGFTPTPMTVATVAYYSGYHPYTLKKVYTPRTSKERDDQHRFFFWYKKENKEWIRNTLKKVKRNDLLDRLLDSPSKSNKNYPPKKNHRKNDFKWKKRN